MRRLTRVFITRVLLATAWYVVGQSTVCADYPAIPPTSRLRADVVTPMRYRLDLTVIPDRDTFTGTIEIDVRFTKPAQVLWLNADDLTLKVSARI